MGEAFREEQRGARRIKKILRGEFGEGQEEELDRIFPVWRSIVNRIIVQAKVLGRKHILASDPRVRSMNDTQWLMEAESLFLEEEKKYKELGLIAEVVKKTLATYLGLNIMPVQDEETGLYREPEDHEIIPLSVLCGRPEILEGVINKRKEMMVQEEIGEESKSGAFEELTPEELDETMSDIDFLSDPIDMEKVLAWNSPASKYVQENIVEIVDKAIKVEKPESSRIKIETDGVSHEERDEPKKFKFTIETD